MIGRVQDWAGLNSGSGAPAGLAAMADRLCGALAVLPGPIERLALAPSSGVNAAGEPVFTEHGAALRLRVRPEAPVQVALTGHYDTVFPPDDAFQACRWLDDGETLNGPGVADMKGGIIVMLEALAAFEAAGGGEALGYEVLLSPDEEVGSPASAPLLAALGARAHVGMTYEPALPDGALASARKGSANYALVLRGRAAHVGRAFESGVSALIAAAEAALALHALNGLREGVTFNAGAIEGGGPVNVVPDRAVLRFNVRAPDAESRAWAEAAVHGVYARAAGREGVAAHLQGGFTRPPKPFTPAQARLFGWTREAGAELGLDLRWAPTGGVCEGNNLAAAGCPNVDTLGVRGGAIHSDQEYALASSFAERAKLSFLLLRGFAQGRWPVRELRG